MALDYGGRACSRRVTCVEREGEMRRWWLAAHEVRFGRCGIGLVGVCELVRVSSDFAECGCAEREERAKACGPHTDRRRRSTSESLAGHVDPQRTFV